MKTNQSHSGDTETIVQRLSKHIEEAKRLGFEIRNEWLDGLDGTWCVVGGAKILFLDLSMNAAEQLDQVKAAIAWHHQQSRERQSRERQSASLEKNRAA